MKIEQTGQFRFEITFDSEDEKTELRKLYTTVKDLEMALETWIIKGMAGD